MYAQTKLIDSVRSFSPGRDKWVAKPAEALPKKVTVLFETGSTAVLDMKNPRAVVWVKLLDLHQRHARPVYVEIDPESNVITQLLLPQPARVMDITPRGEGDVDVTFFTSEAPHYLRRENPDFGKMLEALQTARDNRRTVLVTSTWDDGEIIDVRSLPESMKMGSSNPPPAAPPDPPVTPQRAQELFDEMSAKSCDACNASCSSHPHCIPFKYPYDGCYARAHEMCRLMIAEGESPEKVWIYGSLHVPTSNWYECDIDWSWHVAPTLMVSTPGAPPEGEKYVIDPSLCTAPVTVADWQALQNPGATLRYSTWEPFWSDWWDYPEADWASEGITDPTFSQTDYYLELKCQLLQQECVDHGPPPYQCPIVKSCHIITDRNTFSESEIASMLHPPNVEANIEAAFYVVVDGFRPSDFGITAATFSGVPSVKPDLTILPNVTQMSVSSVSLDADYPLYLNRRQRLTWTYKVTFTGTNGFNFAGDVETVALSASISTISSSPSTVSDSATIYLIKQPNPYEIDGETSWLSTDLRVFQILAGQSKFGVPMGSDPLAFIQQVIENLNSGNTGGQTFENDISVDQQTSRLELSEKVGGTAVYNFAVARVRYRSLVAPTEDVRVFFRLIPWATTSVSYNQAAAYRRDTSGGKVIPLLGLEGNDTSSIPCFAKSRIDSALVSMTTQDDPLNVKDIPADAGGNEVVRYFGCWLDINQATPRFPVQPSPIDGPYASGMISVQDHVRGEHQCLVAEIAFDLAPIQSGAIPASSDKLAQRNLAIVESANPGISLSRRIPQTFEIRPSGSVLEHDELMIDWGDIPVGSVATLYLPGIDINRVLSLATRRYRTHRLIRIDENTLKFDAGGITYLPIPVSEGSYPGLLTVDLPEGIKKGQVFRIVVRQVIAEQQRISVTHRVEEPPHIWRHITGSFQLTIPVRDKADILPRQQRLLSNLRWIERAIPAKDRWSPVFSRYVTQIADRVDGLGGDSKKVGASPSGEWRQARTRCGALAGITALLTAGLFVAIGVLTGGLTGISAAVLVLLIGAVYLWRKNCRPGPCHVLRALLVGAGIGAVILGVLALIVSSNAQLIGAFIAAAAATVIAAILSWRMDCFRR
jgi:hypothetical protein